MASIQADWNEYNKLVKDMKDIERRSEEEQLDKKKAVNEKTIKIVENLRLIEEIAASSENLQT